MHKNSAPEQVLLSNGIPVILQNYEGTAAATYWWIQTGSSDEAPKEAGFAHFLEHMLFKDTAAKQTGMASTGQMARAIESLGGDINAYTSFDQTVYHVTCASQHWEKVIDSFGTIAKPQRFLKGDFEREREVILEELKKNEDSPSRMLFQALFTGTFPKHPYGRPVIGFVKTLKAAKVGDLEAFYRRNYVSARMGLIMVGPIEGRRQKILKLLEKRFGSKVIPKKDGERFKRPMDAEFKADSKWTALPFDVTTPTVSFSFRVPQLDHADIPALDLASSILTMGELGRMYQSLFYKSSLVTDTSGGLYVPKDPGMLYFQSELDDLSKILPASQKMFEEIVRLKNEGPTQEELQRVIVNSESERLYATQTADGMAGRLGFLSFIVGDLSYDQKYIDQLKNVSAQDIQTVIGKYCDYRRMSGVCLVPKGKEKSVPLKALAASAKKHLAVPAKAAKGSAKKASPSVLEKLPQVIHLSTGATIIYRERPQSHVVSLHAAVLGGLRMEIASPIESSEKDWGSSYMMSLTWAKGTARRDANQISQIIEGSAAGMDGFAGRNTVGIQLTGLSRDWERLSELFTEVLVEPSFAKSEVDHSRRVAEDAVKSIEDHTSHLCSKLFLETLFEKHPYGRLTTGTLQSLASIDSDKLRRFHRAWVRPERLVVSVVGSVDRKTLDTWAAELNRALSRISVDPLKLTQSVLPEGALKAPRWVERNLGREQLHILVGGIGTNLRSPDRLKIQLLHTLLGGQSGRLFIELREKRSLAYSVAPVSFEGIENGYIGTYIASGPKKRDEALVGIQEVHQKLAQKGPTSTEMARAKEFFLGRRAMDMQSDSALASHYGLETVYGLPILSESQIAQEVRAVSAKDIQEVCRKYLVEPSMVTAVVG